jgi:predicted DNA-binding transcriptional regulator AlpA
MESETHGERGAESDRLKHENAYLMARVIEVETELRDALHALRQTFVGLHALESIKLLKAGELAKVFQVSTDRVYELVRTHGLPMISFGSHQVRFDPIAVRRWLDDGGRSSLEAIEESELETGLRVARD